MNSLELWWFWSKYFVLCHEMVDPHKYIYTYILSNEHLLLMLTELMVECGRCEMRLMSILIYANKRISELHNSIRCVDCFFFFPSFHLFGCFYPQIWRSRESRKSMYKCRETFNIHNTECRTLNVHVMNAFKSKFIRFEHEKLSMKLNWILLFFFPFVSFIGALFEE